MHPMLPKRTTSPQMDGKKATRANRFMNKFAYPTPSGTNGGEQENDPLKVSGGLDNDENNGK